MKLFVRSTASICSLFAALFAVLDERRLVRRLFLFQEYWQELYGCLLVLPYPYKTGIIKRRNSHFDENVRV